MFAILKFHFFFALFLTFAICIPQIRGQMMSPRLGSSYGSGYGPRLGTNYGRRGIV